MAGRFPYDAASYTSPELADWYPLAVFARHGDQPQPRPDGRASAGSGAQRRLGVGPGQQNLGFKRSAGITAWSASLTIRALQARFGGKYDVVWANEYRQAVEARWRSYSEDPGHFNDVGRQMTVTQQLRLALRHKLVDGEDLLARYWLPDRIGLGAARYATAWTWWWIRTGFPIQFQQPDTKFMRGGVEIDALGAPVKPTTSARRTRTTGTMPTDSMQWERIIREDADGFQRVIHDYDRDRAGQSRGVSIFSTGAFAT